VTAKDTVKAAISMVWLAGDALAARLRPHERLVVLYYHAIPAEARGDFARQMNALARRARVVRAGHVGALARGARCVAITFDDAFQSVAENALPALLRHSLPATVFVPVDALGAAPSWKLERNGGREPETVMTADELRSLPGLIELGSHSLTHPHLTRLDDARLRAETAGSRRRLVQLSRAPVTLFAFPYGEHDRRVLEACREAGYERVFGIAPEQADLAAGGFVRGRVAVDPRDGPLVFHLKMRGAYAWMCYASALKQRLLRRKARP
jgi:peptidoglycan/xylan/chitin deacetylase (PgdA/CDA1 family)